MPEKRTTLHGKRLRVVRSEHRAMAGNGGRPWQDPSARRHRALSRAAAGRCGGTRNARYDEAFEIVQAIGMLRARLDEHAEFASELEGIRATYRAKRNFIKLLAKLL